ncbi:cytochrome c family protein [Sulfuritalea sp.]|uniref:cytochrome c family protein n=1 Tax=Sulfuritalea sp. TaxID=2480090 RepID=UPI001ACD0FC3|nr:cytochrome c family protein [Sulfuritalea sp.]MBN8475576.1 cytochrome C554 [Sulfuritalea sp.]
MNTRLLVIFGWLLAAVSFVTPVGAQTPGYTGNRVCAKCHFDQGEAWRKTGHAKAFDSLKPNVKAAAKTRAGLDPAKDYSADPNCVACHVTGHGENGGYKTGMNPDDAKLVIGVSCESCHGAGSIYRQKHADAVDKLKASGETTDRQVLIDAKQNFDYESACVSCHLNYQGSPWAGAKAPFSPFTPKVDPKYQFDFNKAVRATGDKNPVHTHYKLRGVFKGGTVPAIRAELQQNAQEPEE